MSIGDKLPIVLVSMRYDPLKPVGNRCETAETRNLGPDEWALRRKLKVSRVLYPVAELC